MPSYNLAIVGFGNVGRALLRLLIAKEAELRRKYDIHWRLTGVATRRVGWFADPDGFNPIALLNGYWPARAANSTQPKDVRRSEEHTSELQSPCNLVCRLLLGKKKKLQ